MGRPFCAFAGRAPDGIGLPFPALAGRAPGGIGLPFPAFAGRAPDGIGRPFPAPTGRAPVAGLPFAAPADRGFGGMGGALLVFAGLLRFSSFSISSNLPSKSFISFELFSLFMTSTYFLPMQCKPSCVFGLHTDTLIISNYSAYA
jgi:hypothetical protein